MTLDLTPKLERGGNAREGLLGSAGPGEHDRPEAQHSAWDALIDGDCLDLGEQGLDRFALNETMLGQDPLVRHSELSAVVANGGADRQEQADPPAAWTQPPVLGVGDPQHDGECDAEEDDDDRRYENRPVEMCPVDDALAIQQMLVEIAHGH